MGMRRRSRIGSFRSATALAVAAAAVAIVIGSGAAPAVAGPAVGTALDIPTTDTVQPAPCPVEVPDQHRWRVKCGILTVPERRDAAADPERVIELPFAVVASTSADPALDPLVLPTSGGPGGGSLSVLWYFLDHAEWATGNRDVIVVEQRGDVAAEPTLDCPELDVDRFYVDGRELTGAAYTRAWETALTACRDRLVDDGVDLSAYTSAASAADLADLRAALGYDLWNLYGVSYGARLALTTMRDRPAGLRSVILDGTYPPNVDSTELHPAGLEGAVAALVAACRADQDCAAHYPRLERDLEEVLDRAEEQPFETTVRSPADGSEVVIEVDDQDLALGLFNSLYDADTVRVLPFLIDRLAQGDTGAILPLAQQRVSGADDLTEGQRLSIECAEEHAFTSPEEIEAGFEVGPLAEHMRPNGPVVPECEIWGVPALDVLENQPVTSSIPTLLTVGGYDPVTPLPWSEVAAQTLSTHYLHAFPTMGHGAVFQTWVDECPASIAEQFLADPLTAPDSSCIDEMPPTDFLTASDIHPTSAVYRLDTDVLQGRSPAQSAFAVAALVVFALTLLYSAVYGLQRARRRTEEAPPGAVLTATSTSGLYLAFGAALGYVVLTTDRLVLAFGVPPVTWLIFLLPTAALALAVLSAVLLVIAWIRDDGGRLHRFVFSITAVVGIAFGLWLLSRGLLFI